jgi:hypothetical protein
VMNMPRDHDKPVDCSERSRWRWRLIVVCNVSLQGANGVIEWSRIHQIFQQQLIACNSNVPLSALYSVFPVITAK